MLRDSDDEQKKLFDYLWGYKSFIRLNGTKHMIFMDCSMIIGQKMESETISVGKAFEVINDVTTRFLDEFLCGEQERYSKFIKNDDYVTSIDRDGQPIGATDLY